MSHTKPYRRIRVSGDAHERGLQYGRQAREEVLRCRTAYEEAFQNSVGWTWAQAIDATAGLVGPVESAFPQYLDEMRGIAAMGGCVVYTFHPQIIGRPGRLPLLERLLRRAVSDSSTWVATSAEIAAETRKQES